MKRFKLSNVSLPRIDALSCANAIDNILFVFTSPIVVFVKKENTRRAMRNPEYAYLHKIRSQAAIETGVDEKILIVNEKYGLHLEHWRRQQELFASTALPAWISKPVLTMSAHPIAHLLSSRSPHKRWDSEIDCFLSQYLAFTLGQQLQHMSQHLQCYPPTYESLEDWENDLQEASRKLLAYAAYYNQTNCSASPTGSLKDKILQEETIISEAKQALHWVAENLENLWN